MPPVTMKLAERAERPDSLLESVVTGARPFKAVSVAGEGDSARADAVMKASRQTP
jgi:hypothetical protein